MKRYGPGWAHLIAMPFFEEPEGGGGGGGGEKDLAYYQGEAKKAFEARDLLKKRLRELEEGGLVISAEQKQRLADLEKSAAEAEEEKKRKAGEFDSWRKDVTTKHADELKKRDAELETTRREIATEKIEAAFGSATDYFGGGEHSKTILTPRLAVRTFSEYVTYEEFDFGEEDGGKRKVLIVRDAKNKIIRGEGGHPATFLEALPKLLDSHPDKDHILRGSGKAGSGARGGAGGGKEGTVDFSHLTPAQMRDPKIIEEAKRRTARAGGIVSGEAWERTGAKT